MQNEIHVGDNLEIMKSEAVSRFSGSVSMIYIDPPYNTQTNKSYNDKVDSDRWRLQTPVHEGGKRCSFAPVALEKWFVGVSDISALLRKLC
jgi:DNA modification methylase